MGKSTIKWQFSIVFPMKKGDFPTKNRDFPWFFESAEKSWGK
jgi:hypothetical protein